MYVHMNVCITKSIDNVEYTVYYIIVITEIEPFGTEYSASSRCIGYFMTIHMLSMNVHSVKSVVYFSHNLLITVYANYICLI